MKIEPNCCRLCFSHADRTIQIFGDSITETVTETELNIVDLLAQYFLDHVAEEDTLPKIVCTDCWTTIETFHRFVERTISMREDYLQHPLPECVKDEAIEGIFSHSDIHRENIYAESIAVVKVELVESECQYDLLGERNVPIHTEDVVNSFSTSAPKTLICDICGLCWKTKSDIRRHLFSHVNKPTCSICKEHFASKNSLERHLNMVHSGSIDGYEKKYKNLEAKLSETQIKDIMAAHFDKTCDLCTTELPSLYFAKDHYLTVHKVRAGYLKCCNLKLSKNKRLLDHIGWHIDPTIFMCPKCQKDLKIRDNFLRHMNKHQALESKQFNCKQCNKVFESQSIFNSHMERVHLETRRPATRKKIFQSNESHTEPCQQQIPHEISLEKSVSGEQNEDIEIPDYFDMKCDSCSEVFKSLGEARSHYLDAHCIKNGYLKCCQAKLTRMALIRDHIAWHIDPHIFRCNECNKSYWNRANLRAHLWIHKNQERKFICGDCNKVFPNQQYLNNHQRHHELVRKHICEFCGMAFKVKQNLDRHLRTHDRTKKKRKFQCNICHSRFRLQYGLATHMLTHNSEPQKCDQCDKVSPNANALKLHIRAVHGESKFKCHLCGKKFKLPSMLKDHIAMHMGQKNHKCTFCDETFTWRANMYSHRRNVHQEIWFAEKSKLKADQM